MKFNGLFQVIDLNFNINDFIRNKDISPIKSQRKANLSRMKVHYLRTWCEWSPTLNTVSTQCLDACGHAIILWARLVSEKWSLQVTLNRVLLEDRPPYHSSSEGGSTPENHPIFMPLVAITFRSDRWGPKQMYGRKHLDIGMKLCSALGEKAFSLVDMAKLSTSSDDWCWRLPWLDY